MNATAAPIALVALPGTGSDADYARRAFGPAAELLGLELVTPQPADDLIAGYRAALDAAAKTCGRILVAGVSIGASVGIRWALDDAACGRAACAGVLAALPPWSGAADSSVAAASATATAAALRADGLDRTIDRMVTTSPEWLGAELARSWRALYPALIGQLTAAAGYRGPTLAELAALSVPLAVTAAVDDPLHPIDVGRSWAQSAPRAELVEVTLAQWGADPGVLGDTTARAWLRLVGRAD